MSTTTCTYPIVGAVRKADDVIGPDRIWRHTNELQRQFLGDFYFAPGALAELARIPELSAIASRDASEINAWLAERKFNITLDPFPPHGFGTASMLDVAVQWLTAGIVREVRLMTGGVVPGVVLKEGVSVFHSRRLGAVARIETKNGDTVGISRQVDVPTGLHLADYVRARASDDVRRISDYEGVHFPMVDLDQQPDISWLVNMETLGDDGFPYFVAQALQQTKFKMNQFGARVKSAAAIGVYRSSVQRSKPPLVIDGPFLVWIERPGLSRPFFVGFITDEDMKDPGDLSDM